jgi:hypothetical protein
LRGLFKSTVLLAFVLTLLIPTTASANKYLAWLEELSGPGPFKGPTVSFEIRCFSKDPDYARLGLCRYDRSDTLVTIDGELSIMDDRPKGYSGDTSLVATRGIAYVPLGLKAAEGSTLRAALQQTAVGAGLGLLVVSGDTTIESPVLLPVLPIRFKVLPIELFIQIFSSGRRVVARTSDVSIWRRLGRAVEYRAGWDYTLAAPDPSDFRTAIPEGKREFLGTTSIQIDIGKLVGR